MELEPLGPADEEGVDEIRSGAALETGKLWNECLERHPRLEPRQRGAEAEMLAEAEADVALWVAGHVEAIRIRNCRSSRFADPSNGTT